MRDEGAKPSLEKRIDAITRNLAHLADTEPTVFTILEGFIKTVQDQRHPVPKRALLLPGPFFPDMLALGAEDRLNAEAFKDDDRLDRATRRALRTEEVVAGTTV